MNGIRNGRATNWQFANFRFHWPFVLSFLLRYIVAMASTAQPQHSMQSKKQKTQVQTNSLDIVRHDVDDDGEYAAKINRKNATAAVHLISGNKSGEVNESLWSKLIVFCVLCTSTSHLNPLANDESRRKWIKMEWNAVDASAYALYTVRRSIQSESD